MLSTNKLTEKLCREYDKYKSLYIAFDFDNTVQEYSTGEPIFEVIMLLEDLKRHGMKLILFTCGDRLEEKVAFCNRYEITPDFINENPDIYFGEGKPYFNVLLDDRAGGQQVYESLIELIRYIDEKNRYHVLSDYVRHADAPDEETITKINKMHIANTHKLVIAHAIPTYEPSWYTLND